MNRQPITISFLKFVIGFFLILSGSNPDICWAQGRTENPLVETQLPTGTGGEFSTFNGVKLDNQGQVFFQSNLQNVPAGLGTTGIYLWQDGMLTELVRSLEDVPGGSGDVFSGDSFADFACADSGLVSFYDETGVFRAGATGIDVIAAIGQATPDGGFIIGFPSDAGFDFEFGFDTDAPPLTSINSAGQVAFRAGTSISKNFANDVFRGDSKMLLQLSSDGFNNDASCGPLGPYTTFETYEGGINSGGQVAFGLDREVLILVFDSNCLINSVLENDVNDMAQVVFTDIAQPEGIRLLTVLDLGGFNIAVPHVQNSTPSPDGIGLFETPRHPRINNAGEIAFQSEMSGGTPPGLFRITDGQLEVVVRSGDPRPGGGSFDVSSAEPAMNESGTIVFQDGSGGIFLADDFETIEVQMLGESEFIPGTINALQISTSRAQGTSLNDFGQVAYIAETESGQFVMRFTPDLRFRSPAGGFWDDSSNWTLGISPDIMHCVTIDPDVDLTVNMPLSNVMVRDLQLGAGTGIATLNLNGGSINSEFPPSIATNGVLTGFGEIANELVFGGQIISANLTFDGLFSFGSIIDSEITVLGEMINASTLLFEGETELIVHGQLTNGFNGFGCMQLENGIVRAGSLVNEVELQVTTGTNHIYGDVENIDTGMISVLAGNNLTFSDDLIQNGSLVVENDGAHLATAVVFGDFSGSGGFSGGGNLFVIGDMNPGNSPSSVIMDGNVVLGSGSNTDVELEGTEVGEFDQLVISGDATLDGNLSVQLLNDFQLQVGQQFLILDVSGNLSGQFNGLGEGSLVGSFNGVELFISYAGGHGNDVLLTTLRPFELGDADGDGVLSNLDIAAFVLALTNPVSYQAMFPDVDPDVVLDMNGDGVFDNLDIAGFVAALTGGGTK